MSGYVLLLIASLLTCGGQLCQKQAAMCWRHRPPAIRRRATLGWLVLAVALMLAALLVWLGVLQRLPLSQAYPMLSLNFVLVTLCAHRVFNERISGRHWCGVAFIMAGIALMGLNV